MTVMDNVGNIVAAAGALGIACFGMVEALKWTHYLPNYDGTANSMQLAAARYANAVLAGLEPLVYG